MFTAYDMQHFPLYTKMYIVNVLCFYAEIQTNFFVASEFYSVAFETSTFFR